MWKSSFLFLALASCASSQKAVENLSKRKAEATRFEDVGRTLIAECKSKPVHPVDEAKIDLLESSRLIDGRGQSVATPYEVIRVSAQSQEIFIQTPTGIETASSQWNAVFPEVYEVHSNTTLQPLLVTYGFVDSGLKRRLISKVKLASETDSICLLVTSRIQSSQEPMVIYSFGEGLARAGTQLKSGGLRKAIYAYPFGELIFSSQVNGSASWEKTR